jgi:hypothetical protein
MITYKLHSCQANKVMAILQHKDTKGRFPLEFSPQRRGKGDVSSSPNLSVISVVKISAGKISAGIAELWQR